MSEVIQDGTGDLILTNTDISVGGRMVGFDRIIITNCLITLVDDWYVEARIEARIFGCSIRSGADRRVSFFSNNIAVDTCMISGVDFMEPRGFWFQGPESKEVVVSSNPFITGKRNIVL